MYEYKLKISKYMDKKVIVKSNDENDEPLIGMLDSWTSTLDNEPDGESITVDTGNGLFEVFIEDIKSIELI